MALHTAADIFSHSAAGVKGQDRKKLKKIVDNMANKNVKGVVNAWK